MRGVNRWPSKSQPKTPTISGVRVNTAAALTGGAVFSPSNMATK